VVQKRTTNIRGFCEAYCVESFSGTRVGQCPHKSTNLVILRVTIPCGYNHWAKELQWIFAMRYRPIRDKGLVEFLYAMHWYCKPFQKLLAWGILVGVSMFSSLAVHVVYWLHSCCWRRILSSRFGCTDELVQVKKWTVDRFDETSNHVHSWSYTPKRVEPVPPFP